MGSNPLNIGRKLFACALLLGILVACVLIRDVPVQAAAGINQQFNFQGRLLNAQGATVPDGLYNIEFKIYQDGDGQSVGNTTGSPAGTLKWTEDHLNSASNGVQVKNGFLSVQLGSITAFGSSIDWNQDTLWLSMNVAGTGGACTPFSSCSPDGEMIPMKRLSATPYALNARYLGGLSSAQYLQLGQGAQTDNTTNSSVFVNKTNTGNLLELQTSGAAAFTLSNAGDLAFGANANHTLSVATAGAGVAGKNLTISAGGAGTGGSTLAGGNLVLQGGAGGGTNGNGGNITIDAGVKNGTGTDGTISIGGTTASAVTLGRSGITTTIAGTSILLNAATWQRTAAGTTALDLVDGANTTLALQNGGAGVANFTADGSITAATGLTATTGGLTVSAGGANVTGNSVFQTASNSPTAFQIKNSTNSTIFTADTSSKIVSLGSGLTQPIPNFNSPTLTTTGGTIPNATTYYYGITALTATAETEISPIYTYTVASATNTNVINLSWTQSTGATGYKIYRNTSNSFTSGSLLLTTIGSGATTTYSDTGTSTSSGLPPSTVYVPTTVRVDSAANNPYANGQVAQLGSIYYNTTLGEFQCYKDSGVGGSWSDCGVTTLQGAYNNSSPGATDPTIKLDSNRGAFSIQDANTTLGADLFDIRASSGSGLGAVMFGVSSTGTVTVQNPSDQSTSFRVLNQAGTYLFNANTSAGYIINNGTRPLGNDLQNPSFETGGTITSGEQGWNGPAQASIVNSSANAHSGNYEMQVTPNATTLKTYAGTYYGVFAGDVIHFEGWVKNSAGANGTGGIIVEGYDKDKSLIGSTTDAGTLPGTTYIYKSVSYTVPSNVKYVRVAAIVNSGANAGTYYFDDFHLNTSQRGQQIFQNTNDSTAAFMIQSASASQTLFTADTTNNILKVGDSTGSDTATTILVLDSATANPTTSLSSKNGGLFYRSDTSSLKAIVGGTVVDVCTTAVTCTGYSASASSSIQLQGTTPGTAQTGNFNITGTGILTQLQTQDQSAGSTNSSALNIRTGNATGATSNSGNLTLDVGTATGTLGTITIGHSGVATTMPGTLAIQGSNALALGTSSSAIGSILLYNSAGANTVTLKASGSNPTSSWNLVLPQNPGNAGDCLKDSSGNGSLTFSSCTAGATTNLQDVYNNSSSPATVTLADNKDLKFVAQDTTTDSNILFDLQCTTSCGANGRFAVRNGTTDVLTVNPNSGGIILNASTQIGSATTDATQTNFQLDSYNGSTDTGTCNASTNQGVMYYNTTMGSIRSCINGSWNDLSNPDTLGLMSFGIVPSSGSNPFDLTAAIVAGASGPCKVSWASNTSVSVEACVAYSGGRRVNVSAITLNTNSATTNNTNLTTTNRWGHICLTGANSQPAFTSTSGAASPLSNNPTFSVSAPILCLASVQGESVTAGKIDNIYDVRAFTSTIKEAVIASTAAELGMLVDSNGTGGAMIPATSSSQKLYGVVVATDGSTSSTTPNMIVTTVGTSWVKAIAGTAGQFIKTSATNGYGDTTAAIPNNSFYYSVGNTRTAYSTTCTAANNCSGSLYVNLIVR